MKIAVSSDNQTDITGHAGHCLQFWIYEVDADNGAGHAHTGACCCNG